METTITSRGFGIAYFTDAYGVKCNIQQSSLAIEGGAIWLGCIDANPRVCIPGQGWTPVEMPAQYLADTRMHLTRDQVIELLPLLKHFVETGELPAPQNTTPAQGEAA